MTGGGGKGCGDVVLLLCCCEAWRGHNLASTDHWHWPGRHGAHTYWWFAAQTRMWKQAKRRIFSSMINDYRRRYIFARKDWLYDVWLLAGIRTSVARLQQVRCAACSAAVLQTVEGVVWVFRNTDTFTTALSDTWPRYLYIYASLVRKAFCQNTKPWFEKVKWWWSELWSWHF